MPKAYEKIADDLRDSIRNGRLLPGDRLPSEAQLREEYTYSQTTIRHALSVLESEGLIERRPGRGCFIREPAERQIVANDRPTDLEGVPLSRMVQQVTARPPTAQEAEDMGLPRGTAVLVLRTTVYGADGSIAAGSDTVLAGDRTELRFTTPLRRL